MRNLAFRSVGFALACAAAAFSCGTAPETPTDDVPGGFGGTGGIVLNIGGSDGEPCTHTKLVRQGEFMVLVCIDGEGGAGGDDSNGGAGGDCGGTNTGGTGGGPTSCEDDTQCPERNVCEDHLCTPNGGAGGGGSGNGGSDTGGTHSGGSGGNDAGGACTGGEDSGGSASGGASSGGSGGSSSTGGSTSSGGTGGGGTCSCDHDCTGGEVCEAGVCVPRCDGHDHPVICAPHKATICHIPPGNHANLHTICVGKPAVPAHLAHGDRLGACQK